MHGLNDEKYISGLVTGLIGIIPITGLILGEYRMVFWMLSASWLFYVIRPDQRYRDLKHKKGKVAK